MQKKSILSLSIALVWIHTARAQTDSSHTKVLDSIVITAYLKEISLRQLPPVEHTYIYSGKKSERIFLAQTSANFAEKTARQVFAKVPGIFVYDMDGSGNQINIASRGLDPHRGWEFNLRKDGVLTNSDMYGYPASHYSMPLESISQIELVRGSGSLQYGAQFGGMLNYITKSGDSSRPFSFESINTIGSFNLLSTYNAIGGKKGSFRYYAYYYQKSRAGYRDNEQTKSSAHAIILAYEPSPNLSIRIEWARSVYNYRMAGPLTDAQFHEDPRQATRSRNYFNPDMNIPSIILNWKPAALTSLQFTSSAVIGKRSSILFDKPTNIADTINAVTLAYNNRQIDIDRFNSYTNELRLLQQYKLGKYLHATAIGLQYMHNDLHRTQQGKGSTGSDYDMRLTDPVWGRDLHFKTGNLALFVENRFQLLPKLSATAGARVEIGETRLSGKMVYYPENEIPVSISHRFPLLGAGLSYTPTPATEFYAGWAQAYRPMLFKDLVPASTYEKVDPTIKDARGYTAELGFRGNWKFLRWDLSAFLLQYNNRFGTLAQTDDNGDYYAYRTNIGNALTSGLEFFVQGDWILSRKILLSAFTSTALMDGHYTRAIVKVGNENMAINGNKIESVPGLISRNGLTLRLAKLSISGLYSYTSSTYADALNTEISPVATAAVGKVPGYGLLDLHGSYRINNYLQVKVTVSNATNKQYFTKRPMFYPGPGIWPSDGRSVSASFILNL